MGRNKLDKFADMATYPNVYQFPHHVLAAEGCPLRGAWKKKVFANSNPIVLELGCGRGEYVVALGRKNPDVNYIGVDIKGARMWTGATQAVEENLRNVAFLRAEIENTDKLFAPDEVDTIWLTFSDPQMKKVSKRLTSTYFLERYRRFLKDGGTVNVKTDSNFLFIYTYHVVCENGLPLLACSNNIYAYNDLSSDIIGVQTYYERQWLARGMTIKFVSFALTHSGELREPDIEIPLDTYRSYNRDKRSSLAFSK